MEYMIYSIIDKAKYNTDINQFYWTVGFLQRQELRQATTRIWLGIRPIIHLLALLLKIYHFTINKPLCKNEYCYHSYV